jgi:hypothetical protein
MMKNVALTPNAASASRMRGVTCGCGRVSVSNEAEAAPNPSSERLELDERQPVGAEHHRW